MSRVQRLGLAIMLTTAIFHYDMPWKAVVFVVGYILLYLDAKDFER